MKFSAEWLGDFVDAGGVEAASRALEQAGLPVESTEAFGADTILEVAITPNRPDAMSHRGIAREISAIAGLPRKENLPACAEPPSEGDSIERLTSVVIEVPGLCRRFGARVIRSVADGPSGEGVRRRLAAIGGKPISAPVDATNYSLWTIGQPLHAFDLDRLRGGRIIVRKARRGERLVTLDGIERELEPSDVVVADVERPVSLAGIMGGLETAVSPATKNVLLEAAWWDPVAIRRTARRLGMHTDASHRFERGADPEAIPEGLNLAARLILEAAGGRLAPGMIDARGKSFSRKRVSLRLSRLKLLAGDERLDLDFAQEALSRLGFSVERRGKRLTVSVPSFRQDVAIEDDLVEEVLRVYGYDQLPSRVPPNAGGVGGHLEPLREVEERLADAAVAAGFCETVSYPFLDHVGEETPFAAWLAAARTDPLPLSVSNPLDETRRDLRATLLPGILDALSRNARRGERDTALFEIGRAFGGVGDPERPESLEARRFAFALSGGLRLDWGAPPERRGSDFFDAKGFVEKLLSAWVKADHLSWTPFSEEGFVPGATALVSAREGRLLGIVGQVGSGEAEKRRLAGPVFAGELLVDAIPSERRQMRFQPFSAFPAIEADLSFQHPRETRWEEIVRFVGSQGLADLESFRVVDRYEGRGVASGEVKTTLRLTFRSPERTLAQEEVNRETRRLAEGLISKLG